MDTKNSGLVSAIVVTCRAHEFLQPCLESLEEQRYARREVILVDTSADALRCGGTRGYGQGLNEGIRRARGEFILCLNDDVILDRDFISEALRGFSVHPAVGMVTGRILRMDRQTIDSTGLFLSIWAAPRERGYGRRDRGQYNRSGYVFGASGAAALYRRGMIDDLAGSGNFYDPALRFFYEDLDVAVRAQAKGWKGYYCASALAFHLRGGSCRTSAGRGKAHARRYLDDHLLAELFKSRARFLRAHAAGPLIKRRFIPSRMYDCAAGLYFFLRRPGVFRYLCQQH